MSASSVPAGSTPSRGPPSTDHEKSKSNQQTFTWSTPFFDLQFVDIRTKKGRYITHFNMQFMLTYLN